MKMSVRKKNKTSIAIAQKIDKIHEELNEVSNLLEGDKFSSLSYKDSEWLITIVSQALSLLKVRFEVAIAAANEINKDNKTAEVLRRELNKVADDTQSEPFYLIQPLVEIIKVLANYASVYDYAIREEIGMELEWPAIVSVHSEWDARKVGVFSNGCSNYDAIVGSLGKSPYRARSKSFYARLATRLEERILQNGEWADCRKSIFLPWFLDLEKMDEEDKLTQKDFARCRVLNPASVRRNRIGKYCYRMAFAIRYLAYMTMAPAPMRQWLLKNWCSFRISAWEGVSRMMPGQERGGEQGNAADGSGFGIADWMRENIEDEGGSYFEGFEELLKCEDEEFKRSCKGLESKPIHRRFAMCCDRVVNAFLLSKGVSYGIKNDKFNRNLLVKVPCPEENWSAYLKKMKVDGGCSATNS